MLTAVVSRFELCSMHTGSCTVQMVESGMKTHSESDEGQHDITAPCGSAVGFVNHVVHLTFQKGGDGF